MEDLEYTGLKEAIADIEEVRYGVLFSEGLDYLEDHPEVEQLALIALSHLEIASRHLKLARLKCEEVYHGRT